MAAALGGVLVTWLREKKKNNPKSFVLSLEFYLLWLELYMSLFVTDR